MAAAASAASNPQPGMPPVTLSTNTDREQWLNMDPVQFQNACETAFQSGDFSYVQVALRANHETSTAFIQDRVRNGVSDLTGAESFQMLQMFQKTNAMLTALTMRNSQMEINARAFAGRINKLENDSTNQDTLIQQIGELGEAIKEQGSKGGGKGGSAFSKPISEYKALQSLPIFNSERNKFRDWNDKLINALAQVNPGYRQAIKFLNKKLESMDGVIPEDNGEDLVKVMNGKLTQDEYDRASQSRKDNDDLKDLIFTVKEKEQFD